MSRSNPMHHHGYTLPNGQKADDAPEDWPFGTAEPPRGDDAPFWPSPPTLDDIEEAPF